ncbi:hypothetical protein JX265_002858 [Neoarthrinium moseri]|uniref:Laccase n=1 Tax=Neoarthrinium moseri TaxID=1658444 RepID=A0A9Q0ASQ2_9PEZI|nr:hypothetical protein JX265_002858 [Neoarthrinium moseri]
MGWLRECVDFALQIVALNPFSPFLLDGNTQRPLDLPHQPELPSELADGSCPGIQCPTPQPFKCSYPTLEKEGWEFCNTEDSRDCWIRDPKATNPIFSQYDVLSDYENLDQVPPGITREYWLEVTTNETVKPDGVQKILGNYFNGTYPGPTLEACWGDQLVIHVTNRVSANGTTIHWHGIRQLYSNEMDGVNGITQCPISDNDHFTYNFTATQYGHTWYHSHYSLQYPDGVTAPLIIHGPTSANWDIDLGPILISDWVHETAYIAYDVEMSGGAVSTDSIVVNGHGHYQDAPGGSYFQTCFTPGKKHLLKLINGASTTSFKFSIDDHNMTVVANDLVAIEPFEVDSLFIGIGQRYTVIVQAKDDASTDYWMRTVPTTGCGGFSTTPDNNTAVVKYNSASTTCPTSPPNAQNTSCEDVHTDLLNPIVPWRVDHHPRNNVTKDTFFARLQDSPDTTLGPPGFPYVHWLLQEHPLWINFSRPTILDVDAAIADPNYVVIEEEYDTGFVYLVLDASHLQFNVTHPIHLHGSDFVVLAQSAQPWNETTGPELFRYDNPPRRDVAMLPGGGFLALAFKPDNPGAWLLHCHIAWHASSGLALQILIRPRDVPGYLGDLAETRRVCETWAQFPLTAEIMANQEDSGV